MVDVEAVLLDELGRLSPLGGFEQADWTDVVRRVRVAPTSSSESEFPRVDAHRRRRKLYLSVAAALLLIAVAAPALAFRAQIIDFLTAAHAPKNVVVYFGRLEVAESQRLDAAPGVFPARARRVTSIRLGGKTSVLYVAPTRRGGFCAFWTSNEVPDCVQARHQNGSRGSVANVGWSSDPSLGVDTIEGEVLARDTIVKVSYADGATAVIPYVWVTAPIDAGFFLYEVPKDRRLGTTRPVALAVVRNRRTLEHWPIEDVSKTMRMVDHRDRWGHTIQTVPEAIWSKRRQLFSFNLSDGTLAQLWVMPSREGRGRRCVAGTFTLGCEPAVLTGSPVQLTLGGTVNGSVFLSGEAAPSVARLELRYQDGVSQIVTPKDGFVLIEIGQNHYRLGHRLVRAAGLDATGRTVGNTSFDVARRDLYPCRRPRNYGYGVKMCP
jgi:hypothetical protein